MKWKLEHCPLASVLAISGIAMGCNASPSKETAFATNSAPKVTTAAPAAAPQQPVSNRPANHSGSVLILEYHHIRDGKGDMFRKVADFQKDLETLYEMGFRPVTVSEYLDNKMGLARGASPVVMTFDDSNPSQFKMLPDGTVDPTCAVGVWQAFAAKHPDFPVNGTFYVLPDVMWAQPKFVDKKVEMLKQWGSELANHTTTHPRLGKLTDEQVKKEIATASDRLAAWGVSMPPSLALPFGMFPKNRNLLQGFDYQGKRYDLKAAMLVGADPAPSPTSKKLNRYRIPRIQAYPGELGSDYWLKQVKSGAAKVYVE